MAHAFINASGSDQQAGEFGVVRMDQKSVGIGRYQHLAFLKGSLENCGIDIGRPPRPQFAVRLKGLIPPAYRHFDLRQVQRKCRVLYVFPCLQRRQGIFPTLGVGRMPPLTTPSSKVGLRPARSLMRFSPVRPDPRVNRQLHIQLHHRIIGVFHNFACRVDQLLLAPLLDLEQQLIMYL